MSGSRCRSRGDGSLCLDTERHSPCSTPLTPPGVFVRCPGVASEGRGGGLFTMAVSCAVIWTVQGAGGWRTGRMHTCRGHLQPPGPHGLSSRGCPLLQPGVSGSQAEREGPKQPAQGMWADRAQSLRSSPAPGLRPRLAAQAGGVPSTPRVQAQGHAPLPQHPALSGWSGSTWGLREPGSPEPAIGLGRAPEPLTPTLQPRVGRPHLPTPGRTTGWNKAYSRNPGHTPGVGVGAATTQWGSA